MPVVGTGKLEGKWRRRFFRKRKSSLPDESSEVDAKNTTDEFDQMVDATKRSWRHNQVLFSLPHAPTADKTSRIVRLSGRDERAPATTDANDDDAIMAVGPQTIHFGQTGGMIRSQTSPSSPVEVGTGDPHVRTTGHALFLESSTPMIRQYSSGPESMHGGIQRTSRSDLPQVPTPRAASSTSRPDTVQSEARARDLVPMDSATPRSSRSTPPPRADTIGELDATLGAAETARSRSIGLPYLSPADAARPRITERHSFS